MGLYNTTSAIYKNFLDPDIFYEIGEFDFFLTRLLSCKFKTSTAAVKFNESTKSSGSGPSYMNQKSDHNYTGPSKLTQQPQPVP